MTKGGGILAPSPLAGEGGGEGRTGRRAGQGILDDGEEKGRWIPA